MKNILTLLILFVSTLTFGQNIEIGKLWRSKGVYDSVGNFIERAKTERFLYGSKSNQFQRLVIKEKLNMENGEVEIFTYKDTLSLKPLEGGFYKIENQEELLLTFHPMDSLTVKYKGYTFSYIKLNQKRNKVDLIKFKSELLKEPLIVSVPESKKYKLTFQENGLVKYNPLDRDSEWESAYKIIHFNGFVFLKGITSAPKLITKSKKGRIEFIIIDYRFENKNGELNKIR